MFTLKSEKYLHSTKFQEPAFLTFHRYVFYHPVFFIFKITLGKAVGNMSVWRLTWMSLFSRSWGQRGRKCIYWAYACMREYVLVVGVVIFLYLFHLQFTLFRGKDSPLATVWRLQRMAAHRLCWCRRAIHQRSLLVWLQETFAFELWWVCGWFGILSYFHITN